MRHHANVLKIRAGDEIRTRDPQLGRLMLYQLSYSRLCIIAELPDHVRWKPAQSLSFVGRIGFEPM